MRLKQVSLAAAISVVAGLTTASVGLTGPVARADGGGALPLSHYAHMVVDGAHQHLFFSQGAGTAGIVVTDLAGAPVATVDGERGADGLALSADGRTLYAALTDSDAIAVIDTATLTETGRVDTGTDSAPVSLAVAGGKIWYSYTDADGKGTVGSVDPAGLAATPQPGMPHWPTAVTWTAPVAADGTITVKDTPSIGGANTYTVDYAGDGGHQAVTASATVQVARATTSLSVAADASTYAYGATATVTAHLGTMYDGRTVSLWATPAGGKKALVKTGTVDSKGNLRATYKVTRSTTFTASYAGDHRYAPATATRAVSGQVKVAQALSGYYTSTTYSGTTYRVYHRKTRPTVTTTVSPNKSGQCVEFQAQEYYSGAWHTLNTSGCFTLGSKSAIASELSLSNAVNQKFRVRSEYVRSSKDTTNVSTWGGWQYLTVRT